MAGFPPMPGLTAADCTARADLLERLADDEPEAFRAEAYRQMAAYWRALARMRAAFPAASPGEDDPPGPAPPLSRPS
jgi:hypothetical protein